MLAVPLQAGAAASMAFCAAGHHAAAAAATHAHPAAQAHGHDGAHAHAATSEAAGAEANPADGPAEVAQPKAHKCSACASCCSAGAMLMTFASLPSPDQGATRFVMLVTAVAPFVADGQDRPPRRLLA